LPSIYRQRFIYVVLKIFAGQGTEQTDKAATICFPLWCTLLLVWYTRGEYKMVLLHSIALKPFPTTSYIWRKSLLVLQTSRYSHNLSQSVCLLVYHM